MEKRVTHHGDVPLNTGRSFAGRQCLLRTLRRPPDADHQRTKACPKRRDYRAGTRARYQCHYNVRHPGECDGQSGYGVDKLDKLVDQIIRIQLGRIQNAPSQELIAKQQAQEVELVKSRLNLLNEQYRQKRREYQDLRAETIKVIKAPAA